MNDEPFWRKMAASQKAQERRHTPGFERMLARAGRDPARDAVRRPPMRGRLVFAGAFAAAAAAIALAVVTMHPPDPRPAPETATLSEAATRDALKREIDQAIASLQAQASDGSSFLSWHSPTDFLLTANNHSNNNTDP